MHYQQQKLTLESVGSETHPTDGHIHLLLQVKTEDFEGQTVFGFKWNAFALGEEGVQDGFLTSFGAPLEDEKTQTHIYVKIEYKLLQKTQSNLLHTKLH